jgi:hypothetical protein
MAYMGGFLKPYKLSIPKDNQNQYIYILLLKSEVLNHYYLMKNNHIQASSMHPRLQFHGPRYARPCNMQNGHTNIKNKHFILESTHSFLKV